MSNFDINVDRRTDGRTENRTPIAMVVYRTLLQAGAHPATSRCDKNTDYNLLKSPISLRKSMILLVGISLKRSFTVFMLKYFVRI